MGNRFYLATVLIFLIPLLTQAQSTVVKGVVTDRDTKQPLPFVNVLFSESTTGTITDMNGRYTLRTDKPYTEVQFSFLGYKLLKKKVQVGTENNINTVMVPEAQVLDEVIVKADRKKERYRNKNNPAVDLVKEMISHRDRNRMQSYNYTEYEQYEKLQVSLSNPSIKFKEKKIFKKYSFLFNNIDTTSIPGKALLPVYLEETIAEKYHSKSPEKNKTEVKAHQKATFDDTYIDNAGLTKYLTFLYNDIDIYDNNITLLTNQFLSPIADTAPIFYKFYLTDTITTQTPKLAELTFVPRNAGSFLFQGKLYVTMDSTYAVQQVEMSVNKNINLNWVRELLIDQSFEKSTDGKYLLSKSRMRADFGLSKDRGGIYGERDFSLRDFKVNNARPSEFYDIKRQQLAGADSVEKRGQEYWSTHRHDSLSHAESKVYQNIDSLQKMPSFKRTLDFATLALAGYKNFRWWEMGPFNTFYSFDPVEGFRLRIGGRTTPKFNDHLYFETYGAYGFKDKKWKYYVGGTYSFNGRSIWRFPVNKLKVSYQQDVKIPGQELQFIQEDNFLLSFKRGINDKWLYNNILNVEYLKEFENHFSYKIGFKNWRQMAAGGLRYEMRQGDDIIPVEDLTTTEFSLELRIAPKEQFYQGKLYRVPIPNKYPIISLRGTAGFKGLFNGQYNYQNVTLSIFKRVYLSQFGFTDILAEGGYLFGKVPFPLLDIHRANQTYSYQLQSYNMMNFLEFVSDKYVSVNFDHYFNGLVFNRIPLFKKLHWREVVTLKVLYGSVRNENNPQYNTAAYLFPTNKDGVTTTYSLQKEPYMEASFGIANILNFFRIDLVKRLTYYDHPDISKWGIRGRFKFDF